jgi:hypothetical protein
VAIDTSPSTRISQAKRIGDPAYLSRRIDHQYIETDAVDAPFGMLCQDDFAGAQKPCLLADREGGGSLGKCWTRLYFDDRQDAGFFGNSIDFAGVGAKTPRVNGPTVGNERGTCGIFGSKSAGIGGPASVATLQHAARMAAQP